MTFSEIREELDTNLIAACQDYGTVGNWIDGRSVAAETDHSQELFCPYTGGVQGKVPLSNAADVDHAIAAASSAFKGWRATNVKERAQVMYRFKALLEANLDDLASMVSIENGKTLGEAKAEILKGIEVVEFACSIPNLVTGRILEVSEGIDCSVRREPLGVVASVTPFNFPIMVPLWTIPIALTLGNAVIHKPSEQVPLSPMRLAKLLQEAGLPAGVYNVVHGARETVEAILDHPDVRAVSFVGSTPVAEAVYRRGCVAGKRVLALGGAKNHLIVMPDADPEPTARAVVDAATGCAGQRCMATSVLLAVGESGHLIDAIADYARSLEMPRDMGAIISRSSAERISSCIDQAEALGARPIVDGRNPALGRALQKGFWVGPTLLDGLSPDMAVSRDEIFGPVLSILRVDSLEEALEIENASPYGNAASIFTRSGSAAQRTIDGASAGMVGVNVAIPVPREPFGFGGWNNSKFGVGDITGESSVALWTQDKKVTARWGP